MMRPGRRRAMSRPSLPPWGAQREPAAHLARASARGSNRYSPKVTLTIPLCLPAVRCVFLSCCSSDNRPPGRPVSARRPAYQSPPPARPAD
ncbi:unnamed protein product [Arctogadus glacialis]